MAPAAFTGVDMAWTRGRLEELAQTRLAGRKLVVVGHREPYIHQYEGEEVRCLHPATGLVTALDPILQAMGGVWVAHGSGSADRAASDEHGHLQVPPDRPAYTLRRVWLTKPEEQGYYYGFANEALWPLCHVAFARPRFDAADWEQYQQVNLKFADAVLEEVGSGPAIVFVQDYHFALAPRLLKHARPDLAVVHFWHIPWPTRETFRICPWGDEILDGLLGSDLIAFHAPDHCHHFLQTVDRTLESRVDRDQATVTRAGKVTRVRAQPLSIDPERHATPPAEELRKEMRRLRGRHRLGDLPLLVGIDRIDYTKGIVERLRAVDRLLTLRPELKGKFGFLQVGAPSRLHLPAYRQLNEQLDALVEEINWRHGDQSWRPILFLREHLSPAQRAVLYRMAAGCVVTPLHSGMSLIAKEFIAARSDLGGVLVLSKFSGAARELDEAVLVNPFAVDELAHALLMALTMSAEEQERRMGRLRQQVVEHNIYRWAGTLLGEASQCAAWPAPAHANGKCAGNGAAVVAAGV
jgi:trehalose 6-phosphate synthase